MPQIGLNWITQEQNVSTKQILPYSFCEEPQASKPKHEIYTLQFLFDNNNIIANIQSPFSCSACAQNFSGSKEHFQNLEVHCDWSA